MSLSVDISLRLGKFALEAAFEAGPGVTAIFGPSGSGKTTLINAVAGLARPERGRILVGDTVLFDARTGIDLPCHKRRIGYVFQDGRLFPHLSVEDNLLYGQRFSDRKLPAGPVVEMLGLEGLLTRKPAHLSGGEKQRVAIGRALLADPQVLLMDEPLAALDAARKDEILPYLERLRDADRVPVLYVSHAMSEVARLANHLVLLRDGKVARQGPLDDILADPAAVRDIGLREAGALITARVAASDVGDGLSELATSAGKLFLPKLDLPEGAMLRLRIQASDVILSKDHPDGLSALNILPATVSEIYEGGGPGAAILLTSGTDRILARITMRSARALKLRAGMKCFAILKTVSVAPRDIGGQISDR